MTAAVQRAIDELEAFVSANGEAAPATVSTDSMQGQLPSL
jgi:hypothetical protein